MPLRGKIINVEKSRIDKVLSNDEIQALITAIGTGVHDEFNLEDARYHKVVLMTDADVDGAHIRTLVLTFLYRQMPELIEAGYVYIAKPPLYKLKQGGDEIWIEREAELEELLLRDKLDQFTVMDADGKQRKLSKRRWQDMGRHYKAFEGWVSTLRAEFGHEVIDFIAESHLLEARREDDAGRGEAVQGEGSRATAPTRQKLVGSDKEPWWSKEHIAARASLASTGCRRSCSTDRLPGADRGAHEAHRARRRAPLRDLPGREGGRGGILRELRRKVLEFAREGVQLQRFKGLGEMNPEQLRQTTMIRPAAPFSRSKSTMRRPEHRAGVLGSDGGRRTR